MSLQSKNVSSPLRLVRILAANLLLLTAIEGHAQLPELASPSSASGVATSARFFGGASADNGVSFKSNIGFSEPIDVSAEIRVEPAHVNTVGNLYLIIALGNQYFVRDENDGYQPWDLTLPKLLSTRPAKTLQASEPLSIVNDVAFGPAGLSDVSLSVFLAYDSMAAPGELYYSGAPLTFSIAPQVVTPASLTLFTNSVSSQIIQATCIVCHVNGGVASANSGTPSQIQYLSAGQANSLTTNYNTLVNYIKNVPNGSTLILSKPQGGAGHIGGALLSPTGPSSQNFLNFKAFVDAVLSE